MIVSGGENIYPAEVEAALYSHPAVRELAVVGVPDPYWGETPKAYVAVKSGANLTLEDLRSYGASRLAKYKLPRLIEIVPELPRTASGKVLKRELRLRHSSDESTPAVLQ